MALQLGNPLLDIEISVKSAEYLWSHGVISDELLDMQRTICNETRYVLEYIRNETSNECSKVWELRTEEMGNDTVKDDILLPTCVTSNTAGQLQALGNLAIMHEKLDKKVGTVADPCLTEWSDLYLNKPEVQKALHANTTFLPYAWEICSGPLQYRLDDGGVNIIPLLSNILKEHIPVLLFRLGKIAKLLARDLKLVAFDKYGPWYDGFQIGGWSQSFGGLKEGKNVTYLTFATVRGAAHEVPYTSPSQALTHFRAFLGGHPPPRKSSTITASAV
uniref:Serine carboxypeptidase-like 44 n=1 Tax=Nicotiana tabacum TaxID=4097 RepID=A0A1S4AN88_TOBAC|nr:PREDICTED: serine carboxypeptidase-like 44 [Nicotiana tabacum]